MKTVSLPTKTAAALRVSPLAISQGEGQEIALPITASPEGSRLCWLPVLFFDSDLRNHNFPPADHIQKDQHFSDLEPTRDDWGRLSGKTVKASEQSRFKYGPLVLDASRHEVNSNGQEIKLTPKEFRLLEYLLRHPGWIRTREMLLNAVWGDAYDGTARTVDVHIRRIKKKIPLLASAIVWVRSLGYKLRDRDNSLF
ncbi:MAG: hypothetical protein CV089_14265 [Nitrospira sp. WS110]|nr:hypothetical protein [Nitrospira sp. WS110]